MNNLIHFNVSQVPSTRRPTTKPTRKVIATTTAQQTLAPQQADEVVGEDEDDDDDEDEEEDDDEVIVANANEEPAEQSTPFAEGRIRTSQFTNARPHTNTFGI